MATKKITDLTQISSAVDSDLLIIETSNGTKAINKENLIPKALSAFTADSTHRLVTDTEKSTWNAKQSKIRKGSIAFTASGWGYDTNKDWYWQNLSISSLTANDKIDLQPDATVIKQMLNDGATAMYVVNSNGIPVGYTLGAKLTADVTVQYTLTEVE